MARVVIEGRDIVDKALRSRALGQIAETIYAPFRPAAACSLERAVATTRLPISRVIAVPAQCRRARNALRRLAAMSAGQMIEVRGLTKRYGATLAVDGLSFTVRPGLVTGFPGPNGAGKTTTMRLILGLDRPAGGEATLGGRRYQDLGA